MLNILKWRGKAIDVQVRIYGHHTTKRSWIWARLPAPASVPNQRNRHRYQHTTCRRKGLAVVHTRGYPPTTTDEKSQGAPPPPTGNQREHPLSPPLRQDAHGQLPGPEAQTPVGPIEGSPGHSTGRMGSAHLVVLERL